jgi:uncharacterized protein
MQNNFDPKIISAITCSKHFELILFPTEKCNFRCTYCYEDFSIGRMSRDTIDGIKRLIEARIPELRTCKIEWFGGEPLIARDIVYEISAWTKQLAIQYDVRFMGAMTTNGFLLNTHVFDKLLAYGVNQFQISLDGPSEIHDLTRLRINQTGSFEQIWNNLLMMHRSNAAFSVMLRLHVTPDNYLSILALIQQLKSEMGGDQRFKLFPKAIANLGGENGKNLVVLKGDQKNRVMMDIQAAIGDSFPIANAKETSLPTICYAAQANAFAIRADGSLAKCTVALNDPTNSIGRIHANGTLSINQKKLQPWLAGIKQQDPAILKCPLTGMA